MSAEKGAPRGSSWEGGRFPPVEILLLRSALEQEGSCAVSGGVEENICRVGGARWEADSGLARE